VEEAGKRKVRRYQLKMTNHGKKTWTSAMFPTSECRKQRKNKPNPNKRTILGWNSCAP
jgi:hypothetical protein